MHSVQHPDPEHPDYRGDLEREILAVLRDLDRSVDLETLYEGYLSQFIREDVQLALRRLKGRGAVVGAGRRGYYMLPTGADDAAAKPELRAKSTSSGRGKTKVRASSVASRPDRPDSGDDIREEILARFSPGVVRVARAIHGANGEPATTFDELTGDALHRRLVQGNDALVASREPAKAVRLEVEGITHYQMTFNAEMIAQATFYGECGQFSSGGGLGRVLWRERLERAEQIIKALAIQSRILFDPETDPETRQALQAASRD